MPEAIAYSYGDGLGEAESEELGDSELDGLSEVDGDREAEDELDGEVEALGLTELDGELLIELDGLSDLLAELDGETEALIDELGDCDRLAVPEAELEGEAEDDGEIVGLGLLETLDEALSDALVLGETEALGEVEALGESDRLAEPEGEVDEEGEVELDGEIDGLGLTEALGEAEALGEMRVPARRATTEEPALMGFHKQIKRIRPDVIAAVATVIVISPVITRAGKLVVVLAIKVACGLVPVQISRVSNCVAVVAAIKAPVESEPPPALGSRNTPTAKVALVPAKSFSTIA